MKYQLRIIAIVFASVLAVAVIAVAFVIAHSQSTDTDDEDDLPVTARVHVSNENGRTVLRLTAEEQEREGIAVAPVESMSAQSQVEATTLLLPAQKLATARNDYLAAQMKASQAQLQLEVARTEYERVKRLYEQNQNMSLKAKQEAESSYQTQQLSSSVAEQQVRLSLDSVRQEWGTVIAGWVADGSPTLNSLLAQQAFVAQVVFPTGAVANAPRIIWLQVPNGEQVRAQYVSPSPMVNAQIQGLTYLYLVLARPGLAAGMNLVVQLRSEKPFEGSFIPESAIVWWDGTAWAYEDLGSGRFTRLQVPTRTPLGSGYLAGDSFPPGTRLVVAGAQLLLSEEFRSQIKQEG